MPDPTLDKEHQSGAGPRASKAPESSQSGHGTLIRPSFYPSQQVAMMEEMMGDLVAQVQMLTVRMDTTTHISREPKF
jgi:hypothetical protein